MPENYWSEEETSYHPLEEASEHDPVEQPPVQPPPIVPPTYHYGGRRRKAAIVLTVVWSGTIALHLVSWGVWLVLGFTTLMGVHALRVLFSQTDPPVPPLSNDDLAALDTLPYVSLLVAAKNEEAVIANLVRALCNLDYPMDRYDLWIIDDNSNDLTPTILKGLADDYPNLHILCRSAEAKGGKSGALNQVLPHTQGDIIAVFDADARVSTDLLRRVVPLFRQEHVGAVQVRKAILQPPSPGNWVSRFLIKGQTSEMILDSIFQEHRIAIGGTGELRGNGQFLRRNALEMCGGWNEETITDDLDLTFRLHLNQWDIDFLSDPPVFEEGVTRGIDLWHQRNRWGEGGYQRYLDYWRPIMRNRMGTAKTTDLVMFWISQYFVAMSAVPDMLMATLRHRLPLFTPITILTIMLSVVGMVMGFRQQQLNHAHSAITETKTPKPLSPAMFFRNLAKSVRDTVYMCHWFMIIASIVIRVSVRPKRLKWVKTFHQGLRGDE